MGKKLFIVVAYKEEIWELGSALGDLFFTENLTVSFKFSICTHNDWLNK